MSQGGSHLNISWRSDGNHPNFTCTTRNPVSKSFQSFLPGDICPGQERNMKLYIGLSLAALVLLCFGISIWWCMWKQKGRRGFLRSMASALDHILGPLQTQSQTPAPTKLKPQRMRQGMKSWTLFSRLPSNGLGPPLPAALTAVQQPRRRQTWSRLEDARRTLDLTRLLRGQQSTISSCRGMHLHLRPKTTRCMRKYSSTCRERP
uniref:T-lymphocyte surface antigen Ly-9-like isoform X3 n=1 Tax=Panthera onca TaxID=9690 RepID=UPI00295438AB|nr:T-lymphocyte surface antigen Ly-9-like isoform X3 [Panthera onca]